MKFLIAAVALSAALSACADRGDIVTNVPGHVNQDGKGTGFCGGVILKPGQKCP